MIRIEIRIEERKGRYDKDRVRPLRVTYVTNSNRRNGKNHSDFRENLRKCSSQSLNEEER